MAETNTQSNTTVNPPEKALGNYEKFRAGILLILFILLPMLALIGYWPDELPKDKEQQGYYNFEWFRVSLIKKADTTGSYKQTAEKTVVDSSKLKNKSDSLTADSIAKAEKKDKDNDQDDGNESRCEPDEDDCTIHLNTLLMLLVSLAGFLGSMIHITSSFTNYVGAEKFKRSWMLWYFVKPFTGAALAMIFYFVFRAGLLSANDPSSINLCGLITLAVLTGLFTDKAAIKLEEIFTIIFKPKDERPDKLKSSYKIVSVAPKLLERGKENLITATGEGLSNAKLTVTINDESVAIKTTTDTAITFAYTIPADKEAIKEFKLVIKDEKDIIFSETLKLKDEAGQSENDEENENDNDNDDAAEGGEPIIKE